MRIETEMIVDNLRLNLKEIWKKRFKNPWESLKFEEMSRYLLILY